MVHSLLTAVGACAVGIGLYEFVDGTTWAAQDGNKNYVTPAKWGAAIGGAAAVGVITHYVGKLF